MDIEQVQKMKPSNNTQGTYLCKYVLKLLFHFLFLSRIDFIKGRRGGEKGQKRGVTH
jgi:hypothetical protein